MLRRVLALLIFSISTTYAQPAPSTEPSSDMITELELEDPLTASSRCYVDLDKGAVIPRGEMIADRSELRRSIESHGIDLMCESREPADGLIAYGLCLRDAPADIDHPPDFVTLKRMFDKSDAAPFDFVSPTQFPKTYLFRTSGGAVGVLEITGKDEHAGGMRIRYRIVHEPPKAPLPRDRDAGRAIQFALRVHVQELRLNKLRETYGENHDQVKEAARLLSLYQDLFKVVQTEPDESLQSLKIAKISNDYNMVLMAQKVGTQSTQWALLKQRQTQLESQIADRQAKLRNANRPATMPVLPRTVNPATQPFAKDFHL